MGMFLLCFWAGARKNPPRFVETGRKKRIFRGTTHFDGIAQANRPLVGCSVTGAPDPAYNL